MRAPTPTPQHILKGRVAIVVGGLGPTGQTLARRLAREGALVVLADLDDLESAVVAEGLGVQGIGIDVTSHRSVEAAFELVVQTYGPPALLWYGVGFHLDTSIRETAPDLWHHGLVSNLDGAWLCAREFLRRIGTGALGSMRPTLAFALSTPDRQHDDALSAVTRAGFAALARVLEYESAEAGLRAGVFLGGPVPGSGGERILRKVAEREGIPWRAILDAPSAGGESPAGLETDAQASEGALTLSPDDLAEAVIRLARRELPPREDRTYPIAPRNGNT